MNVRVRNFMLLLSFLLFPVTLNYLSPYLSLYGAAVGVVSGSVLFFGFLFITSIIVGRLWCGYLCPASAFQDYMKTFQSQKVKASKYGYIKYIIWVLWFGAILYFYINSTGLTINPLFMTEEVISVSRVGAYVIYYGVILIVLITNGIFGNRSFCHHLCWMAPFMIIGRKVSLLLKLPRLRLKVSSECISCNKCTKDCPMGIEVMQLVRSKNLEHSECILCGNCIDSCPKDVIKWSMSK